MPLGVHLHTQVITDLNLAITNAHRLEPERAEEIGGLLLGRIEYPTPARPIVHIERFDPVESEHRRGSSYDLSERDKKVLARKLSWWNSHGQKEGLRPVGFYRSHTRRGLYLDKDDFALLENYFPEPYAVVLLVRPEPAGASVGGFFFWQDGDMHRESSFQEFPFNPAKLPLASGPAAAPPREPIPVTGPSNQPVQAAAETSAPVPPPPTPLRRPVAPVTAPARPARAASSWARMTIPVAAGFILGAIVYGLFIRKPPQAAQIAQPPRAAAPASKPAPAVAAVIPSQPPVAAPPPIAPIEKPSPFTPKSKPVGRPAAARPAVSAPAPPSPAGSASRTETVSATTAVVSNPEPAPSVAAAAPPPADLAPITTPVRIEQPRRPARHATVTVEPVSGSKLGRAVSHIPGLGRLGKKSKSFVPARPIRQITPSVPADEHLARDVPVDVKVTVDPAGNVASADSRGGDKQLARLAVDAARNWQFVPARRNDETVSSELILHFTFKGAESTASSARP